MGLLGRVKRRGLLRPRHCPRTAQPTHTEYTERSLMEKEGKQKQRDDGRGGAGNGD